MSRIYPREVILEYLQTYVTEDYKENENDVGDWINFNSTLTHDGKYRMGINVDKNYVNDFKTNYSNSLVGFVAENQDISIKEADMLLLKIFLNQKKNGVAFHKKETSIEEPTELQEIKDHTPWKEFDKESMRDRIGRKAFSYLLHRGFNAHHIKKFKLKYVNQEDCWKCGGYGEDSEGEICNNCKGSGKNYYYGRIIVPTFEDNKLVYFQGRDFLNRKDFRYMNPRIGKKQVVFFIDNIREGEPVYICEGPFDAMTLIDYPSTCLLGPTISDAQAIKILDKKPSEVIFVPDNDEKSETRQRIIKSMVKNIKKIKVLSDNKIPIGIYQWYKESEKKDINNAGITFIDQNLILYANRSLKGEALIHGES